MHQSSFVRMRSLRDTYLNYEAKLNIVDLGAMDVNGSYKVLFQHPNWTYKGMDLEPGNNVDIVLDDPYHWAALSDASVDVVVSGQALEHVEFFWLTFKELARVLKPGGLLLLLAPSRGIEHRYPVDCWRFYPDGYAALAKWSGLLLLDSGAQWNPEGWEDGSDQWGDCWGVFEKPE